MRGVCSYELLADGAPLGPDLGSWMPGQQPLRVDCMGNSMTSDGAVVTVYLFGYMDGEERTMRDTGVSGVSALITPRSRVRGLTWGLQAAQV
jgi:hypothetical protein